MYRDGIDVHGLLLQLDDNNRESTDPDSNRCSNNPREQKFDSSGLRLQSGVLYYSLDRDWLIQFLPSGLNSSVPNRRGVCRFWMGLGHC